MSALSPNESQLAELATSKQVPSNHEDRATASFRG